MDEQRPRVCAATGEAFVYSEERGLAAFEAPHAMISHHSCPSDAGFCSQMMMQVASSIREDAKCSQRALVCIAGLTDGLLSLRYLPTLAKACCRARLSHQL
eukprot:2092300-Amphidinium_carterae.5